jgi:predicted permease
LIGQLMIESLMLAAFGAAAGVLLSIGMVRALLSFLPRGSAYFLLSPTPDARILAFNAGIALFAAILFGLIPALQAMRLDLWNSLKNVTSAVGGHGSAVTLRKALVTAQVAFSFLLLAGAGLFVKTLVNLKSARTGFRDIENIVSFQVDPSLNGYSGAKQRAFFKHALEAVNALPGVSSAATASVALLSGGEWDSSMSVEGHQFKDGEDMQAYMNEVSSGYWKTMGISLIEGRDFDQRDDSPDYNTNPRKGATVAIVNREFAHHFFGDQSPIGRHVGFGGGPKSKLTMEIVGVVENSLYEGPREGVHRQAFIPLVQDGFPRSASFYVRTTANPDAAYSMLRQKIAEIDPALPVYQMRTLAMGLDENLGTERLIALLSAAFGVLATLLAALGLYGVMAFVVMRRTREIGLRMALGAGRGEVLWMVLREALTLLGIGLAVGLPATLLLSRYVSSQLFSVSPTDIGTAAAALLVLSIVAAVAGLLPARRASSIDPMTALRYE